MFNKLIKYFASILIIITTISFAEQKKIHVYNWSDYISKDILLSFEKQTGIKVIYDVFDSNELLEGKMMSGSTGYNIVFPSSSFLSRQIEFNIFQPINRKYLPNYKHLDPILMKKLEQHDPENKYSIPYLWATTGIGYDVNKIKKILGKDAPINSWDLILNPENLKKLSKCGVSFLDAPEEIFATVLNYLGKNPNSTDINDYVDSATNFLLKLRPYIRYFHSTHYINDLANGNICIAIGWAGDILQVKNILNSIEKNDIDIAYVIPKEGALAFFDMITIPKDIKNIKETYQFVNYLLDPEIIAKISNKTFYANGNKSSLKWINKDIINDVGIYPPEEVRSKLFMLNVQDDKINRIRTRSWMKIKIGY